MRHPCLPPPCVPQIYDLLLPALPPWKRQQAGLQAAEEDEEEEGMRLAEEAGQQLLARIREVKQQQQGRREAQRQQQVAAAVAAAAASGELESLDAFFQDEADADAELAPDDASKAAESLLEDPELADRLEAADSGSSSSSSGGSTPFAATASLDLDAVQEEEEEEDAEQQEAEAAAAAGVREQQQRWRPGMLSEEDADNSYLNPAKRGELPYAQWKQGQSEGRLRPREQRRKGQQERRRQRRQQQQEQEEEQAAAAAQAASSGGGSNWRQLRLPPDELLEHLLADGSLLSVPAETRKRCAAMPRVLLALQARLHQLLPDLKTLWVGLSGTGNWAYFHACLSACLPACLRARRWRGAQRCLLDDAAAHCMPLIPRMGGGELGTLLWSFATMRHVHPGGRWLERLRR
jgi:hypothetical protein